MPATTRPWLSEPARQRESAILAAQTGRSVDEVDDDLAALIARNRAIHEDECLNLNPATNVMNPRAEAALGAGLGSRPSLGHPGEKYEMGLESIEEIEVVAADLACRVFGARFAEVRVGSGALANLYGFMATCAPGDTVLVPPPTIGGHVTHNRDGAAGLYGLDIREYPIDPGRRSSRSARASTCCRIRWPRCVPSPTRSGRSCSTTGRTPAACSPAAAGRCRWPRVPTCSP